VLQATLIRITAAMNRLTRKTRYSSLFFLFLLIIVSVVLKSQPLYSADLIKKRPQAEKNNTEEAKAPSSEIASKTINDGVSRSPVSPAQEPAKELKDQIKGFVGDQRKPVRAPGISPIELTLVPRNGKLIVESVDPHGPYANKYKPGDIFEEASEEMTEAGAKADEDSASKTQH
jgi:hypothetical protein